MRPVSSIAASLGALSRKWLRKNFVYRKKAVSDLVKHSGFSEKMAEALLDALFSELTAPKLKALLKSELGEPSALDRFIREKENKRSVFAQGPRRILHIFSANIPAAAVQSFVLGLLAKSENIGKMSARDAGFLRTYLDSLGAHDRGLKERCRLIPANSRAAAVRWMKQADLIVAYGSDESLAALRKNVPVKTPFVGYGHRISFSLVMREALSAKNVKSLARQTAHDVWMDDQRGCLSPCSVFVQKGGEVRPEAFAQMVAQELERSARRERTRPKRGLSEYLAFQRDRERALILTLKKGKTLIWQSRISAQWTVLYDEAPTLVPLGPGQRIAIKGFHGLGDLERTLHRSSAYLQAASLECAAADRLKLAGWLSTFGLNRICRAGKLQPPPVTWHHDARPNLADWLRWTDLED